MMLSPSFSGTTVWHTARRVRNSCMQGAVGYKQKSQLILLLQPHWHTSELDSSHLLPKTPEWLPAPFKQRLRSIVWTRGPPWSGTCSPSRAVSCHSPSCALYQPLVSAVLPRMLTLSTVPSLPLTRSQSILLFTHPLGFSLSVSISEKVVVTLLLEHHSWSASPCGQVRTKREPVPHPRTPPAFCHPHASSHFCKSQEGEQVNVCSGRANRRHSNQCQIPIPRTDSAATESLVLPYHRTDACSTSSLLSNFIISVSPWPIIFLKKQNQNCHVYVLNTFLYPPQPPHKILTFFIGIRLYL